MAYLSFASQLMENKRRARLTGRQDTSRYQTETTGGQAGAAGRLATGRSIAQANEARASMERFRDDLARQKEEWAAQQAALMAKYAAQSPSGPLGSPVYDDGGVAAALEDWYNYKRQYPAATRLDANDPRLQGTAREPSEWGGAQPVTDPYQFDTSTGFNPDNYDPGLSIEEKWALFLKSLKNPTPAATSSGGQSEM